VPGRERVLAYLDVIDRATADVEQFTPNVFASYAADRMKQLAVERSLHVSIEALSDLAATVCAMRRLGVPSDEEGIDAKLLHAGFLDEEQARTLRDLRRFRNVLLHRYAELDPSRIHAHALRAPMEVRRIAKSLAKAAEGIA
jgi:uncharacterized protein YutE (UPF0331/DUF86 family)